MTNTFIYKLLSTLMILTFSLASVAQEPFNKQEIHSNLNSIDSFITDNIYPLITIVEQKSLYQNIKKVNTSKIGGCNSFATTMAAKFLKPDITNNKEQCSFFRLSVNICTLNGQIKKLSDELKAQKYSDSKISIRLGYLMGEGYLIRSNVNKCNNWASSL